MAGAFASAYGLAPDAWQSLVLGDWLALRGKHWASMTCGLAVPRQNGKNALLEVRELYGAVALGEKILHTAHEVKTAQKHFRRLKYFFGDSANDTGAKFPELNALVERVRNVNGQEAIMLHNGGSIEIVARSKSAGRGFTVDVLVMDEAQELDEDSLEALMPTTSAAPTGNPQWIFTGTPPGPSAKGDVFTRIRAEANGDKPGRACWHEWSVAGDVNLDDRALWRLTNPALDSGRLQVEVIEGERAAFSDGGFARERLGAWSESAGIDRVFSNAEWRDSGVESVPSEGVRSLAVAFSADSSRVATAAALKHSGGVHAEVVSAYSGPFDTGVSQLADWLADKAHQTAMIAIAGLAGAALAQALYDRGVSRRVVHVVSTSEYFAATAMVVDAVRDGSLTHPVGGEGDVLTRSVENSERKFRGQSGGWGWQAAPDFDETPVEAFTVAHWAARTSKRKPGRKQVLI